MGEDLDDVCEKSLELRESFSSSYRDCGASSVYTDGMDVSNDVPRSRWREELFEPPLLLLGGGGGGGSSMDVIEKEADGRDPIEEC